MPALFTQGFVDALREQLKRSSAAEEADTAVVAVASASPRRFGRGHEAIDRRVAGQHRRLRRAPMLHQRNHVIGSSSSSRARSAGLEVGAELLAHRPAIANAPTCAPFSGASISPMLMMRRRRDRAIVAAFVAAAAPLALAAIEVRGVLAARHEHARPGRFGAEHAGRGAAARIARGAFVRGRVPRDRRSNSRPAHRAAGPTRSPTHARRPDRGRAGRSPSTTRWKKCSSISARSPRDRRRNAWP